MSVEDHVRERLWLISEKDKHLHAFIRVGEAEALVAARAADQRLRNEAPLALDGVTVAVKDNLSMAGEAWTAGIRGRQNFVAAEDATSVARLRAAGAIVLGGANMEEAALGAITDNPTFGRCINPLGDGLTPGGSSGGSAAALAASFVDLALGSDTMGSVRVPAAYCGVFGFKPSFDAIDRSGLAMLAQSLDTIGPMALDAAMLRRAFKVLSPLRATESATLPKDAADLRIGVPKQLAEVETEDAVLRGLTIVETALRRLGAQISEIDLKGWLPRKSRLAGLLITEVEGAVELANLIDDPNAISASLRAMLDYGRNASSEKISAARAEVDRASSAALVALEQVDAILMPTTPQRAFRYGERIPANQADLTALANFAKCPAIAMPVQVGADELPASVQLLARPSADHGLLNWAEQLVGALPGSVEAT